MTNSLSLESRTKLKALLQKQEGYRQFSYTDTTGHLTIGIGRNLSTRGISLTESLYLLDNDIEEVEHEIISLLPVYSQLNDARKAVLVDIGFELGVGGLMQFRGFIDALIKEDWPFASKEMLNSKWAEQVPTRAQSLAYIVETGEF
jgi:lysozyme